MNSTIAELLRLAVLVHHSEWILPMMIVVWLGTGALSIYVRVKTYHDITYGICIISAAVLTIFVSTGLSAGAMDDWQHQHGTCLLESLKRK